ncbi:MAG: hypothetical protein PHQ98_00355 [Candidatus ainarchaeum sp.]|nr:hypothetical protein [Candidatus ainarchaeum sp.]
MILKNKKGQTSIEVLLIIIVVLVITTFVAVGYLSNNDQLTSTFIARDDLVKLASINNESFVIQSITAVDLSNSGLKIEVVTVPKSMGSNFNPSDLDKIKSKIISKTNYSSVEFNFN